MDHPLSEELLATLTGQMRERLNHVSAAVQLISPALQGTSHCQNLAILNHNLYQIFRMLNDLDLAQYSDEDLRMEKVCLDLSSLCTTLSNHLKVLAGQTNTEFCFEADETPLITYGDLYLIQRMLLHLISNALRAAGEGGTVCLSLTASPDRKQAVITIRDNGPGIEPGSSGGCSSGSGLGLGLLSANRIAKLHGGRLLVERLGEGGTQAVVALPIYTPASPLELHDFQSSTTGGFSMLRIELSTVLPYEAFSHETIEQSTL